MITTEVGKFLNQKSKKKFNIFFLDPPYSDQSYLSNLVLIKQNDFFEKKHIVIIHREKKTQDNFDNYLKILDTKIYGRSKIIFGEINSKIL